MWESLLHGLHGLAYHCAMLPPSMRELLDDPVFRKMMKTPPRLPANLTTQGHPWAVWALTRTGTWRGGTFPTYADAWRVLVKAVRAAHIADVSLVSRRRTFAPPGVWEDYKVKVAARGNTPAHVEVRSRWVQTFLWDDVFFAWCGRCRRPTTYDRCTWHHAVKLAIALPDEERCFYCGARRSI